MTLSENLFSEEVEKLALPLWLFWRINRGLPEKLIRWPIRIFVKEMAMMGVIGISVSSCRYQWDKELRLAVEQGLRDVSNMESVQQDITVSSGVDTTLSSKIESAKQTLLGHVRENMWLTLLPTLCVLAVTSEGRKTEIRTGKDG